MSSDAAPAPAPWIPTIADILAAAEAEPFVASSVAWADSAEGLARTAAKAVK